MIEYMFGNLRHKICTALHPLPLEELGKVSHRSNGRGLEQSAGVFLFILFVLASCTPDTPDDYTFSDSPREQRQSEKRGVSYAFTLAEVDASLLGKDVSWFYNWGPDISTEVQAATEAQGMDFYPMAWNGNFDAGRIRAYKAAHPQCEYLLAFNEPNLTDQCNYTPQQAAAQWPRLKALANELDMKLVSPAMNYGTLAGYGDPVVWLDEFFELVSPDDVAAIAVHCYMPSAVALKEYIGRFIKYDKPIWLTEFCAWETNISSPAAQIAFMSEAVAYLEADPAVERYAWFIPRSNGPVDSYPYMQLLTKEPPYALSDQGRVYTGMSTQDHAVYALAGQRIEAEHYTACNVADCIGTDAFSTPPHVRSSTDEGDHTLELHDFTQGKWVEYQVELSQRGERAFSLRVQVLSDASISLKVDGNNAAFINLDRTSDWVTAEQTLQMDAGQHVIRLEATSGNVCLNWLKFE